MMVDIAERTVVHVLRRGAAEHPDKVALVADDDELTYAQLWQRSLRVAGGLRELGVTAHSSVVLLLDNSIDHVLAWFGASCLNAAEVALNTGFRPAQIAQVVGHAQAEIMIVDEAYLDAVAQVADQLTAVKTLVVRGDPAAAAGLPFAVTAFADLLAAQPVEPADVGPQDVLGIVYTSGTTGMPKGVLVSQAQTYGRMWPGGPGTPGPDDRTLVVLPIYHVIGQCRGLYNTLIAGGTAVLLRRFSASRFWDTVRAHRITFVPLVGIMVNYLLRRPAGPGDRDHGLRHVALGTTSAQVEEFRERFGVARVSVSYGLTEAGGVLVGPAEPVGCGYLRPDFEARLVDENDIDVAEGEAGELVLRPTEPWTTMAGYHRMPDETLARWRNLWLHTGDLMTRRADGMYLFAGRRSDRIRVRGENVSPAEVEQAVGGHPDVAECAVIGVAAGDADATVGEQDILLAVVARPGRSIDPPELAVFLDTRLPRYAVPRYVGVLAELPRTEATHRVQRNAIAALPRGGFWDRLATTAR
jgi:crotonobetaine/carnitine-CoA ligase